MSAPPGRLEGWRIIAADSDKAKLDALTEVLRDADTASSRSKMAVPPSNCPSSFPNIHLLLTNTRLGGMDGPALIKLVRYMRPGVQTSARPRYHRTCSPCRSRLRPTNFYW
jgi:hypothetical protein